MSTCHRVQLLGGDNFKWRFTSSKFVCCHSPNRLPWLMVVVRRPSTLWIETSPGQWAIQDNLLSIRQEESWKMASSMVSDSLSHIWVTFIIFLNDSLLPASITTLKCVPLLILVKILWFETWMFNVSLCNRVRVYIC